MKLKPLDHKQSGFIDAPAVWNPQCRDIEHNPPSHLHIPAGKQYRHVCKSCGATTVVQPTHPEL